MKEGAPKQEAADVLTPDEAREIVARINNPWLSYSEERALFIVTKPGKIDSPAVQEFFGLTRFVGEERVPIETFLSSHLDTLAGSWL